MERRLALQKTLEELLGSRNVYYQPPTGFQMVYDCIVYSRSHIDLTFADNRPYQLKDRYQVTVIYKNPDSDLPKKVALLPMCSHDRHFTADNLHHDVFTLYF